MEPHDRDAAPDESPATAPDPDLGPLDPPPDYAFEEELLGEPPRPIPPELSQGRHAQSRRSALWGLGFFGSMCIAAGFLPFVQTWALYFLPLGYLDWIGAAALAIAAITWISGRVRPGPYRYVESGRPFVARIRELALRVTAIVNGQPTTYRFAALIDYLDPDTGEPRTAEVTSNDIASTQKDTLTTSFRAGDYVTAVDLPGDHEKTLRLYGFLDLRPGLGVVRRDRAPQTGPVAALLTILAAFGFFFVLGWNVYAYERYQPIRISAREGAPAFVLGAVLLGGGLLAALAANQVAERRKRERRNAEAASTGEPIELDAGRRPGVFGVQGILTGLVFVAGAILLGGATTLCWAFTANAMLDRSPATPRPVQIRNMIQTTHNFILRTYTIEYHFLDDPNTKRELMSTPWQMMRFEAPLGLAMVREGRFGWPWVDAIEPVRLPPDGDDEGGPAPDDREDAAPAADPAD